MLTSLVASLLTSLAVSALASHAASSLASASASLAVSTGGERSCAGPSLVAESLAGGECASVAASERGCGLFGSTTLLPPHAESAVESVNRHAPKRRGRVGFISARPPSPTAHASREIAADDARPTRSRGYERVTSHHAAIAPSVISAIVTPTKALGIVEATGGAGAVGGEMTGGEMTGGEMTGGVATGAGAR